MPGDAQLQNLLRFATELASAAGDIALANFGAPVAYRKADGSEVTHADVAVEEMLVQRIGERFPDHAVIADEAAHTGPSGRDPSRARYCWVIDPVDGTRNYVRRFPVFATSVAVMDRGRPIVGVIRWHHTRQVFTAASDGPTMLDGRPEQVSQRPLDSNLLVGAQLGAQHATQSVVTPWLGRWALRNLGSTALHLALVAVGGLDAAYAQDCRIWDLAVGALLVERAGGECTGLKGEPLFPVDPASCAQQNFPFIAGTQVAHQELLTGLAKLTDLDG